MNVEDRSDAWIRQGANVLAAALAVFIVLPAIYPMPHAFYAVDGTLWAAWAQVVGIVVTGGGAVIVAWTQLRRFNENWRAKNTIDAMDFFSQGVTQIPNGVALTPETGLALLDALLKDAPLLAQMQAVSLSSYLSGGIAANAAASPEMTEKYLLYYNAFSVAVNYFSRIAGLAQEGLLDGKLYLHFFGLQVVTLWQYIQAFAEVDPAAKAFHQRPHLRRFAEQAREAFVTPEA